MLWTNLFARLAARGELPALADEVAARCRPNAWRLAHARAIDMRLPEARGYLRAKSGGLLRAEVSALFARRPDLPPDLGPELLEEAQERLVKALISDLLTFNLARLARRAA